MGEAGLACRDWRLQSVRWWLGQYGQQEECRDWWRGWRAEQLHVSLQKEAVWLPGVELRMWAAGEKGTRLREDRGFPMCWGVVLGGAGQLEQAV